MHTPLLALDNSFAADSKIWIYVAERALTEEEALTLEPALNEFTERWTSHNQALQARGELFNRQIIILMVDETGAGASGCSIDSSVHFLEAMGHQLGLDLFDRMTFGYVDAANKLVLLSRPEFSQKLQSGEIGPDTLVINTLAKTRQELVDTWLMPFGQSWLQKMYK